MTCLAYLVLLISGISMLKDKLGLSMSLMVVCLGLRCSALVYPEIDEQITQFAQLVSGIVLLVIGIMWDWIWKPPERISVTIKLNPRTKIKRKIGRK